jgi:hypothetical protein
VVPLVPSQKEPEIRRRFQFVSYSNRLVPSASTSVVYIIPPSSERVYDLGLPESWHWILPLEQLLFEDRSHGEFVPEYIAVASLNLYSVSEWPNIDPETIRCILYLKAYGTPLFETSESHI